MIAPRGATRPEMRECLARVPGAVREAAAILGEYGDAVSIAEMADCASDQIEENCYLEAAEFSDLYCEITRACFAAAGLPFGTSDATEVENEALGMIARTGKGWG